VIHERLGQRRCLALLIEILRDKTADLRARVFVAQSVIIGLCKRDALPQRMKAAVQIPPGTPEWAILHEGQQDAIQVLVSGLESQDFYSRAGASFALSLCGPEASVAIPALKLALQDENETVRKDAADALRRIEGREE
jgi:HEAT repeat protein